MKSRMLGILGLGKKRSLWNDKKGYSIEDLPNIIMIIVIIAIILGIGASILNSIQGTQTANTTAYNITGQGLTGLSTMGGFQSLLGLIAIFGVIITLVVTSLIYRSRR